MKKFFLTIALAAIATSAFAQIEGLSVGAGYINNNIKTVYTSGSTSTTDTTPYGGFYAGVNYTLLTFGPGISVTPGITFAAASYKKENEFLGVKTTDSSKETYVAVPVNFSYKLDLVPGTLAIAPYAGPTFAYGLGSTTSLIAGSTTTVDNYKDSKYGRFDLMLGGGIALDIVEMIRVSVGYNFGLLDRDSDDNIKRTTSNLNFGVAFLF